MDTEEPKKKFFSTLVLVERLLLFLDLSSILHLAQACVMNKRTVCNSFSKKVWNNLVRQRSSVGEQLKPPIMDLELVK